MISQGMVDEIRRLLADQTLSQRRIARMTGISRATVGAIANGTRLDYPVRSTADDLLTTVESGPPTRCPGCGGRVYLPCRLCHIRRLKRRDAERRRRRRWLAEYLARPIVSPAIVRAADAHLRAVETAAAGQDSTDAPEA
ncbi:MAG: helix-turn-helix transcriptional regulator [Pirellulales bacterium]|nr:helix-turn-helix transcriptional regulator [Pirellulales bacterium]